jgi:hypothetical protein
MIAAELLDIIRDCDSDMVSGFAIESQDVRENVITLTGWDESTGERLTRVIAVQQVEFTSDDCRYGSHRDQSEFGYVVELQSETRE